jgi:hypothetical protein
MRQQARDLCCRPETALTEHLRHELITPLRRALYDVSAAGTRALLVLDNADGLSTSPSTTPAAAPSIGMPSSRRRSSTSSLMSTSCISLGLVRTISTRLLPCFLLAPRARLFHPRFTDQGPWQLSSYYSSAQ